MEMFLAGSINLIGPTAFAIVATILFALFAQTWIVSVQIRRFLHWFGSSPDGNEKLHRLFDVYGWRARLAVKLFRIELPPGFLDEPKPASQPYPLPSGVESLVMALIMVLFLLAVGAFTYLMVK